jgi:microcystin-dependent protein
MSEPFLAEIKIVAFNFAPRGWALCDGQILPINQNQSLYSLLGTTYGGDGRTSFALPDLRSRTPLHVGDGYSQGQKSGEETVALTIAQIPSHTHAWQASADNANNPNPGNRVLAKSTPNEIYYTPDELRNMRAGTVANAGGGQGHENRQPYLVLNFVIALQGLFPPRN